MSKNNSNVEKFFIEIDRNYVIALQSFLDKKGLTFNQFAQQIVTEKCQKEIPKSVLDFINSASSYNNNEKKTKNKNDIFVSNVDK